MIPDPGKKFAGKNANGWRKGSDFHLNQVR